MEREIIASKTEESPHFDDERTLLSAQQVVPLTQVGHKPSTRRTLGLAMALLLAVILGATAALLLVRLRQGEYETATADSAQKESGSQNSRNEPEQPQPEPESSLAVTGESELSEKAPADQQTAVADTRKPPTRHSRIRATPQAERINTDSSVSNEPVLVDQWQERRLRRVQRLERRRGNHHRGDLFRIRDIFEGTRPE